MLLLLLLLLLFVFAAWDPTTAFLNILHSHTHILTSCMMYPE